MYNVSIPMALVDFLPVMFFGVSMVILLIASFVCSMGMGALSGVDFTQAIYNWIEQGINCVGQGLLMAGVLVLHRAGLKEFTLT